MGANSPCGANEKPLSESERDAAEAVGENYQLGASDDSQGEEDFEIIPAEHPIVEPTAIIPEFEELGERAARGSGPKIKDGRKNTKKTKKGGEGGGIKHPQTSTHSCPKPPVYQPLQAMQPLFESQYCQPAVQAAYKMPSPQEKFPPMAAHQLPPVVQDGSMEYRMRKLEGLVERIADTQWAQVKHQNEFMMSKKRGNKKARDDSSEEESEDEGEEWKNNFSEEFWSTTSGRKKKNPFDHSAYVKKGEVVSTFEKVMMITFKTVIQLRDANKDVRGVVKHGLAMAEKASKAIYKVEAFTKYDEAVRERAGSVGPVAFGVVDQEDALRFFSFDNVDRSKAWKGQALGSGSTGSKKKGEKICLKYNDQGCSSKACYYAHKCVACGEPGHSRKDCKALKKKEK